MRNYEGTNQLNGGLITEEDLKVKIVLPYLENLGFSLSEIDFEKNVKVRLGRKEFPLSNGKNKDQLEGRLDLLCKKGDQNLFLIEVKSARENITESDAEQGISYASLLRPIPPFAIVTNGKQTAIYDVITKKKLNGIDIALQSDFWKNKCVLSADEDLLLRYNALKNFIGYSPENLKSFSDSQIIDRMQLLKGNHLQPERKYIPELFLSRHDLIDNFTDFLDSNSQCFALIGESGVGKTNFICGLAEHFKSKHIVLFFNAATLTQSVICSIKDDFNWAFSPSLGGIEILRRIETLAKGNNSKVCIFFDAVDECSIENFNLELDDFVRQLKKCPGIKICISCKESEWENYLTIKGNPSYLSDSIYQSNGTDISTINDTEFGMYHERKIGYKIERFNYSEISLLEQKYRDFFKFKGALSCGLREECKLGFMFKVVGEVFQGKEISSTTDSIKLIECFLDLRLRKFNNRKLALRYLTEIGKFLIDKQSTNEIGFSHGYLDESELRKSLDLPITEDISPELFSYNLLSYFRKKDGRNLIGFYYSKIRDYVISILSLRLDTLNDEKFKSILPIIMSGSVGQSAIYWYYSVASQSHRKLFQEYETDRALIFVKHYVSTIEKHFPNLKDRFEPYTNGAIGILINSQETHYRGGWTLYPLANDEDQVVQYCPFNLKNENGNILILKKVSIIRLIGQSFLNIDPIKAANKLIKDQLEKIIDEGRLNEDNNYGIILEKIINILYKYSKKLGINSNNDDNFFSPFLFDFLPIKCDDILNMINLFYAKRYFLDEKLKENGGSLCHSKEVDLEIEKKAMDAIMNNIEIPQPEMRGNFPPVKALKKSVEKYKLKYSNILTHILPQPSLKTKHDIMINYEEKYKKFQSSLRMAGAEKFIQYTEAGLKEYIIAFFSITIREYKILVETCFPSFKNELPFYSCLPITLYFEVETSPSMHWIIQYVYEKNNKNETIIDGAVNPQQSRIKDMIYKCEYGVGHSILDMFYSHRSFPIDKKVNTRSTDSICVIRNWVLNMIKNEIKYILKNI